MNITFQHPDGTPCLVDVDAIPQQGAYILLRTPDGEEEFLVTGVRHVFEGALATRGGYARFSERFAATEITLAERR